MRSEIGRASAIILILLAGCESESVSSSVPSPDFPEGYVAPPRTDHLPLEDHPEYVNWNKFPVGISVVRKKDVSNDFGTVRVTTTLRLLEKTADQVVVESQITVDRSGEPLIENAPQPFVYPAKFRLPAGLTREQFFLPSFKASHVGDEVRQACDREFNSQLFTWQERNETGPMTVKLWRSDEIPGRMLTQEIDGHMHHSVEEVVELRQPDLATGQAATD